jgi:hypothetical protein
MNTHNLLGKQAIAVWIAVAAIVSVGSLAIAVQPVSDEKIHLQDVDGKIHTNVPVSASRAFSPLPLTFREDTDVSWGGDAAGSIIMTKQKVVINIVSDTAETDEITFGVQNQSEDAQLFLIKAGAPPNVILDVDGSNLRGITGHNEWLFKADASTHTNFLLEITTTDAGMYPIVVELLRVG